MKWAWLIFILAILSFCAGFFACWSSKEPCPPTGYLLVDQTMWDSLVSLANQPPDTIKWTDTIEGKTDTMWLPSESIPTPESVGDVNYYTDSFRDSNLLILIHDSIQGILKHRKVGYELFVPKQLNHYIQIDKPVPFPVKVPVLTPVKYSYYLQVGGGVSVYSLEGGIIRSKWGKDWMLGLQGIRTTENYVLIKAGVLF